jgi:coenzyme PQQ precursor peptide PqqA
MHEAPEQQKRAEADPDLWPVKSATKRESVMNEWLKPQIQESEAGMEVTSYLPAELDRA